MQNIEEASKMRCLFKSVKQAAFKLRLHPQGLRVVLSF